MTVKEYEPTFAPTRSEQKKEELLWTIVIVLVLAIVIGMTGWQVAQKFERAVGNAAGDAFVTFIPHS